MSASAKCEYTVLSSAEPAREQRGWPAVEIGEIADIVGGGTPSTKEPANFDGDIPWLTPRDLSAPHGRVVTGGKRNLSRAGLSNSSAKLVPPGAVLLSTRAPVGYVAIAGTEIATNQGFRNLILREGACPEFVFYWLNSNTEELERHATGTTFRELSGAALKRIRIPFPPLAEQRAIAEILGAFDDKIELNRRMNETLEAMARAIFDDWFVDFGPVRARTEGREPYLAPEVWRLFPDSLSETSRMEIPTGWRMATLPELIEINPKRQLKKGQLAPYLDMANMPVKGHAPSHVPGRPTGSGTRFANGDTLLARITPCLENGKTAYVDFLPTDGVGWGSTEYIVLRPRPPLPDEFAYCLARSNRFREFAIRSMTGTSGRQRVPAAALAKFVLPVPSTPVAEAFGRVVRPLLARAGEAVRESSSAAAMRDALLPRLMSGQLRLGDAEKAAA